MVSDAAGAVRDILAEVASEAEATIIIEAAAATVSYFTTNRVRVVIYPKTDRAVLVIYMAEVSNVVVVVVNLKVADGAAVTVAEEAIAAVVAIAERETMTTTRSMRGYVCWKKSC